MASCTANLDDRLAAQAEDVIALIQAENDPFSVMVSGRARLPSIDIFGSQYYIQIVQLDGRAVQLSENLRGQRLPLPTDLIINLAQGQQRYATVIIEPAVRLRTITARSRWPIGPSASSR